MLKNAKGVYCYRYTPNDSWHLCRDFDSNAANIMAKEGPLPVGAHTWECWVPTDSWMGFEYRSRTLTVTLQ